MITVEECNRYLAECEALASAPELSLRRATSIMAVYRAWVVLRDEIAAYEAIVKEGGG